ncbi:MAG: hypothetical protein LBI81_03385 [Puniceicoccales bacterium]|nr:hypothetical protein [Puniceicoccales bacterium]
MGTNAQILWASVSAFSFFLETLPAKSSKPGVPGDTCTVYILCTELDPHKTESQSVCQGSRFPKNFVEILHLNRKTKRHIFVVFDFLRWHMMSFSVVIKPSFGRIFS